MDCKLSEILFQVTAANVRYNTIQSFYSHHSGTKVKKKKKKMRIRETIENELTEII